MTKFITRSHLIIAGIIALTFLISANIAWLNPKSDYVIKTNEKIPIMWQYNGDSAVEFLTAAYFPEYLKVDKTRTNRPGYPFAAKTLSEIFGAIALPVTKLGILVKGMLGYITLKLWVFLAGALTLLSIAKRYMEEKSALCGVVLAFLHPFAVTYIGTFHTSELEFITPIFLVWMWLNLGDKYSHKKNVLFSLVAGYLMLCKQNYAIYLAILAFSFFILKRYKESLLSFTVHIIPLLMWLLALKLLHIPYYNHESESAGQGVWLYQDLIFRNPVEIVKVLGFATSQWLGNIVGYFSIFSFAALFSLTLPEIKNKLHNRYIIFFLVALGFSWLQSLAANRYAPYMSSDIAFIVFPLAGFALYKFFERFHIKKLVPIFFGLYLLIGLTTIIHFPWVHPYDQQGITHPDRVEQLKAGNLIPNNKAK